MSSQDVAAYLYEVGANERKLEYCRQILASNPNCIPQAIFNLSTPQQPKNTLSKKEFIDLISTLCIACNPQQQELIFSYFQIDAKTYITYDEFATLITPQTDASLLALIQKRQGGQFTLDYSLRYCLQKFFFQVIENQVRLQMMCRFSFQKKQDTKKRIKRLDAANLKEFLNSHGKYPESSIVELILREIAHDKGDNKRNKLITEYILEYNQKMKQPGAVLPKITHRTPSAFAAERTLQLETQKTTNKQNTQSLVNQPLRQENVYQPKDNSLASISSVEQRINSLMDTINIKGNPSQYKKDISPSNPKNISKQRVETSSKYAKQTPFNRFLSEYSDGDVTDRKALNSKEQAGYADTKTDRRTPYKALQHKEERQFSPLHIMKQRVGQGESTSRDGRINKSRMDYLKSLVA